MIKEIINKFLDYIEGLCYANVRTGYWDGERGSLRRKYDCVGKKSTLQRLYNKIYKRSIFLIEYFVKTERESRKNVELRAKYRIKIDNLFKEFINGN